MVAAVLTLAPEELRARQNAALARMVALCERAHPFYQRLFREQGLTAADLQTVDDLQRLPLTRKADLMADPEAFRLQAPDLPVHEQVIWDIAYTTGTTGRPTPVYSTTHDFYATIECWTRLFRIAGVREDDIVANLFPLTAYPSGAFLRTAIQGTGALVLNAMPGARYPEFPVQRSLDDVIRLVERKRPTVLGSVPSFLRRLLIRAEELGADFSSVRLACFTGEPCPAGLREDIRARLTRLGAVSPAINVRLGFTEAQSAFVECREGGPLMNPAPDLYYFEIVHPETGERLPDGEQGLLVMTHLNRRGTVLLRYVLGDITALARGRCPDCGLTTERVLQPPFRADHLTKVRGMLVNPDVLHNLLSARPEVQEYQVIFRKEDPTDPYSMDEMLLRLAVTGDAEAVTRAIIAEVRNAVRVTPTVEVVDLAAIYVPGSTMKARRIIDERPKG
ncbi:MAG: AMP-binding protein [Chloroflexota bacterium]|nr:AMP-binding protein [Dehalococcoidia bacterium]MDW8252999.1 AMP-binding protein [Chloroflexota bacterium]